MTAYEKNQNALIIGGFILISTICVSPMLLFGKTLVLRDTFFEFRFLYAFSKENISNGIIPLWNPYSNCGQPFIANPQSAFFYPLNWIYYLLEFHQAYTLFIFIHLLLAGVFMYAFIKPIVKNSWISFFGGVIYMLNGLLISRIEFASEFASIAWIPAVLALLRINVLTPSWLSSVLLGLAISVQFLAGHTQSFYQTVLFGLLFLAFLVFVDYIREKKTFVVLQSMKFLITAGVLALLIVMIQLAPTYELFTMSLRSQAGYDVKTHLASLHPIHTLTLLYPYLFGWPGYKSYWGSTYEFWASSFYVGVIPFVFCLLAVLLYLKVKKNRSGNLPPEFYYFIFFLVCAAMAFLIALGDYSPVFRFFYAYVPGFAKFRWPSSSLLFCTISMSVIAPLGLQWLLQSTADRAHKQSRWPAVTFGALIAVFLAFAVVMNLSPNITEKIVEVLRPVPSRSLADFRSFVENISGTSTLSDGNHILRLGHTVWLSTSFMIIICVILWSRFSGKLPANYLVAGVIFFTAIDLIGHGRMGVSFLDKSLNLRESGIIGIMAESRSKQRLMALTDDYQQYTYGTEDSETLFLGIEALTGEVGLAQQLFRTEGKGVLKIKNYSDFSGFRGLPYPLQLKILKFLNVKYVLHFKSSSIKENDFVELEAHLVDQYQKMAALDSRRWSVQLTRIGEPMPRIFVVPRFLVMPSDTIEQKNIIFKRFLEGSFDFSKTVIVDEPLDGFTMTDEVKFVIHQPASYTNPNQVKAVIETDRDGILVISDVVYPGWELFVNGEKQKIYKANTTFRAGVLKAGVNNILFNYNPKSFKIGLILTIIGIGLTVILLIVHFRFGKAPLRESSKA
jgi:hypothetical protein